MPPARDPNQSPLSPDLAAKYGLQSATMAPRGPVAPAGQAPQTVMIPPKAPAAPYMSNSSGASSDQTSLPEPPLAPYMNTGRSTPGAAPILASASAPTAPLYPGALGVRQIRSRTPQQEAFGPFGVNANVGGAATRPAPHYSLSAPGYSLASRGSSQGTASASSVETPLYPPGMMEQLHRQEQNRQTQMQGLQDQRRERAIGEATYAANAPVPATQEGVARREAFLARKRDQIARNTPGGGAVVTSGGNGAIPYKDRVAAYSAIATQSGDPDLAGRASGLIPSTEDAYAEANPPSSSSGRLPTEAEAAGVKPGKPNFPLTIQHAKAMFDNILQAGGNAEGYNPVAVFTTLMGEYGINPNRAQAMAQSFQRSAATPRMTAFNPQQRQQINASPDPYGAAERMNPYAPGNAVPGHDLIDRSAPAVAAGPNSRAAVLADATPVLGANGRAANEAARQSPRYATKAEAQQFLDKANGDTQLAKELARRAGFDPSQYAD